MSGVMWLVSVKCQGFDITECLPMYKSSWGYIQSNFLQDIGQSEKGAVCGWGGNC